MYISHGEKHSPIRSLVQKIFNPRTAGGGGYPPPPLRFFADSEKKTAARSAAIFAIAVQPTIWHISKKR